MRDLVRLTFVPSCWRSSSSTRARSGSSCASARRVAWLTRLTQAADELLRLAYRQALCEHGAEHVRLGVEGEPADRSTMPFGQAAAGDRGLDVRMKIEQPKRVRHGRPCLADPVGDLLLGEPELIDQLAIRERLVDRVEIRALDVLHQRDLELVTIGELSHDGGDAIEACEASRTHTPLAGDQLVPGDRLRHEDRLEDAMLADARRKLLELTLVDVAAGLERVGLDLRERDLDDRGRGRRPRGDQRVQAAAERRRGAIRLERHAGDPARTEPPWLAIGAGVVLLLAHEAPTRRARSSRASDA